MQDVSTSVLDSEITFFQASARKSPQETHYVVVLLCLLYTAQTELSFLRSDPAVITSSRVDTQVPSMI